ncbi:MAG: hypothetical protein ABIU84_03585, partial [Thermoanaerobaculia bacterium]
MTVLRFCVGFALVLPLFAGAPLSAEVFYGFLSAAAVNPPNASPGIGSIDAFYDESVHTLSVDE